MSEIKPSPESLVTYHRDGHVGFLTLNRPEKRNALHTKLWNALDEALELAENDHEARVFVLGGAGPSFCAGLDLSAENELLALAGAPAGAGQKVALFHEVKRLQAIHTRLDRLNRPTIAWIQRHCLGGGLELALCCDILLCSEDTVFAMPEAR
ncbi:MAG: enoyl-CoA hydratase/isomerase family protein, partial [Proteobacteria bacterium]|nr:enoyl-CoA hydratase/isomerase family protein [Pseudomonadota bacterium]